VTAPSGPLGVFDSGVGGLTVVGALLRRFPAERVLYVADQAHVPYGGRPLEEIRGFATGISRFLAEQGCRAVVMACNISSAVALEAARTELAPLPVLGVIEAAARKAEATAAEPRVGVLATEGTVRSGAYTAHLQAINPAARVVEVACPRFVPLVEAERTETDEALDAAREYLTPLAAAGCDIVVLGCTHYPYLLPALQAAAADLFPTPITFLDPAHEMADALAAALPDLGNRPHEGHSLLLTTGVPEHLAAQQPRFLPGISAETGGARWHAGRLELV
jgi:glutamate racemase